MWYCSGMSSVVLWGERAFMASWELGQGQIPSLGERVEHRGLLYHDDDEMMMVMMMMMMMMMVEVAMMMVIVSLIEMVLVIKSSGSETMVVLIEASWQGGQLFGFRPN